MALVELHEIICLQDHVIELEKCKGLLTLKTKLD